MTARELFDYLMECCDKGFDDAVAREALCSVETHMFQEVSKTILVVVFEQRTYVLHNVELCTLFRFLIVANVVRHSVLQFTHTNLRVHLKFVAQVDLSRQVECESHHEHQHSVKFHFHTMILIKFFKLFLLAQFGCKLLKILIMSTIYYDIKNL